MVVHRGVFATWRPRFFLGVLDWRMRNATPRFAEALLMRRDKALQAEVDRRALAAPGGEPRSLRIGEGGVCEVCWERVSSLITVRGGSRRGD
ncbi:hypothetical protein SKAU_G00303850 [Synaphobranchus kaupii]|uniref:Uncharacterized protein n=1 Tax=Synaphobranchus kaupii TaxID=118154 RepID=A0A9Q1EW66_SYNKA|nr:hypothetical protein SKAU_G00303850 [Synaphobranchus kaupii]